MAKTVFGIKSALVLAVALSACTLSPEDLDPNAGPNDNAQQGALVGAALGAIAGLAVSSKGDNAKGAIIGAALGAGLGSAVGADLDRQAADLRARLDERVEIVNTGRELIVTVPQDILFEVDSAALRFDLRSDLAALAQNLVQYPSSTVSVVGHTDNTGSEAYNQDLSQRRAASVSRELYAGGVSPGRISVFGLGETSPIATNLTPEGRSQNRRVDVTIRPIT